MKRELKMFEELGHTHSSDADRVQLIGHHVRIEQARAELDEQLRQRLMETAIELANTLLDI